ncbi:MAG: hypothetical protein JRL30_22660 [Deltaproteobacteria bacterium]|nr:hypothetical protein [Deltaproteobacteria bacterium]
MKPRVRIKYCGGCNPTYDRVDLVEQLKVRLGGTVEWVSSEADACDLVLAVQGCETACADLNAFDGYEIYPITCPEDADRFIEHVSLKG